MNKIVLAQSTLTIPMSSIYAHTSEHPVDTNLLAEAVQNILHGITTEARLYLQPSLTAGIMADQLYLEDTVMISATYVPTDNCSFENWSDGFKDLVRGLMAELSGAEEAAVFFNGEGVLISR